MITTAQRALLTLAPLVLATAVSTTGWAQVHDLSIAVLKVSPKKAKLRDTRTLRTGRVILKLRNEGSETLSVADMAALNTAIQFDITKVPGPRTCAPPPSWDGLPRKSASSSCCSSSTSSTSSAGWTATTTRR